MESRQDGIEGDDYCLHEDGIPKPSFRNHRAGKNGSKEKTND